jgi:phage nucleotide-binding protein
MRYVDGILTLPPDNADNALILGTALHTGMEKGTAAAIDEYFGAYPIITDAHIDEAMKLEYLIPKAREILPKNGFFEKLISNSDIIGFADYLVPTGTPNEFDLYDFKYSNSGSKYRKSPQLHIYKHFLEPEIKIRNMYYLIVPKVKIRQKKNEDLTMFRVRIQSELEKIEPALMLIEFDYTKVIDFLLGIKRTQETKEFPKTESYLCQWCEYQEFCEKGIDFMLLPKNERRNIEKVTKRAIWLYGAPFSGKTTFANKFDDPLMLNTDGNIKFVDAPVIPIRDEVKVEGRMTKRTLAWKVFKDAIEELEKKDNTFKTIIVDLLEDMYEHCRLYMYDQMGITHESDDSFRAWDKVTTEFLSTLKRLMNMDYENILLLSHEDTSKDITKKGGDKITAIKPNLREKVANKVAGMVDIVARVIAEGDNHILSFKTSEVIFGGGRLKVETKEIPLELADLLQVYDEANAANNATTKKTPATSTEKPPTGRRGAKSKVDTPKDEPPPESEQGASQDEGKDTGDNIPDEQAIADAEADAVDGEPAQDETPKDPPPVRTRKRRET